MHDCSSLILKGGQHHPEHRGQVHRNLHVNTPLISNDGKYVTYTIRSQNNEPILVVQSSDNSFKRQIFHAENPVITENNKYVIFSLPDDSVAFLELATDSLFILSHIKSYKICSNNDEQWIAYNMDNSASDLVLKNLHNGKERRFKNVRGYYFSEKGNVLLVQSDSILTNSLSQELLLWISLPNCKSYTIMHSINKSNNFTFNSNEIGLAFVVKQKGVGNTLMYYEAGMDSALILIQNDSKEIGGNFEVSSDAPKFNFTGNYIFFGVKRKPNDLNDSIDIRSSDLTLWSYKDEFLPTQQKINSNNELNQSLIAGINVNDKKVIFLEKEGDAQLVFPNNDSSDYLLIKTKENWSEMEMKLSSRSFTYLISIKNGSRNLLFKQVLDAELSFSPNNKFIIWYDREKKNYFTFEVTRRIVNNITKNIPFHLYDNLDDQPHEPFPFGIASWEKSDSSVLIYDQYDIWKVDPNGVMPPINITSKYGRKNRTVLRLVNIGGLLKPSSINSKDTLLLAGFNFKNKYNGFFEMQFYKESSPRKLTMGPYIYYYPFLSNNISSIAPIKAKYSHTYIVQRMTVGECPNFYLTKDFKKFTQLSSLQWSKSYNWMTSELVHWKSFDGKIAEGILYKPENFNPDNKYPLIFDLYERKANELNKFVNPILSDGRLNIAHFVSNGYLVFEPDINYKIGYPGQSVYNYIVSAARYLNKKKWVNPNRMGLQGFSWGGYEVNYLITATNLFAAAASSAGMCDEISAYNSLRPGQGVSAQFHAERGQGRIGTTLWSNPNLFILNSPIFGADKVTTPLLMEHGNKDEFVPWSQAIEYFIGLRRLSKKVWLLEYNNESHGIGKEENKLDYSIRLAQYFDHFLKGAPAPKWMAGE